jgi:hypothetical protein
VSFVAIDHPRFRRVERAVFLRKVVADCMSHQCRLVKEDGALELDACCRYGVDVDVAEQAGILAHGREIAALLRPEAARSSWFTDEVEIDPDFPSGRHVRTVRFEKGCVFLAHDGRGCAVHRASIEGGWDFRGIKPHVCRLFPITYDSDSIVLSDDYPDYSCAGDPSAPSVYRVSREALGDIFGASLTEALDRAEREVVAAPVGRSALRVTI